MTRNCRSLRRTITALGFAVALLFSTVAPADQASLDKTSWAAFNNLLGVWNSWYSTGDLLNQTDPGAGTRYVPPACQSLHLRYPNYRIITQVGKVHDSIFEAGDSSAGTKYTYTGTDARSNPVGLSGSPVAAANGTYLRYEILLNPIAYRWVAKNQLYKEATLQSWLKNGTPLAFPDDSIVIKNAWMILHENGISRDSFHTEKVLLYSPPSYLLDPTDDTCEVQTVGLVGQHLVSKPSGQPAWTWATIEHLYASPNCTALQTDKNVNTSCPTPTEKSAGLNGSGLDNYLLNKTTCMKDGGGLCAACNSKPKFNCRATSMPIETNTAYCIDGPPGPGSLTQACRQVHPSYYTDAYNKKPLQSSRSSALKYILISTQWYDGTPTGTAPFAETVRLNSNRTNIKPPSVHTPQKPTYSLLGNSTMETYERSNCLGCHSSAVYKINPTDTKGLATDFAFWLTVEVRCGVYGLTCSAGAPPSRMSRGAAK